LEQVLEAVNETTVRSILKLFHHILQADEVLDVDIWLVCEVFGCWIQVDIET
jgi:hypothetical protein